MVKWPNCCPKDSPKVRRTPTESSTNLRRIEKIIEYYKKLPRFLPLSLPGPGRLGRRYNLLKYFSLQHNPLPVNIPASRTQTLSGLSQRLRIPRLSKV